MMLGSATGALCQLHTEFIGADGETFFSRAFLDDRRAALARSGEVLSIDPLLALLNKYTSPEEIAEIELTIGVQHSQRAGLVDRAKSVTHLTRALAYKLPEHAWLQATVWRGGSLLLLERYPEALRDALRVLVSLSYRDMSQTCPRLENPVLPFFTGPGIRPPGGAATRPDNTPEELQRMQDYRRYREHVDQQRMLSVRKYAAIDYIQRIQSRTGLSDADVRTALREVSPDSSRPEIIFSWVKSQNVFPGCSD
jgi:hypothetical protein